MKRKNRIKLNLVVLVIPILFSCSLQKEKFYYVLNDNLNLKEKKLVWGVDQEFYTERIYSNKETFSESRLFTGSNDKSILYKKEKGIWYYFNSNKKWNLFYNSDARTGGVIEISGKKYKILFKKELTIRHYKLHEIVLKSIDISQSHNSSYYFDVERGVILIKMGSVVLLRTDSFENPLTEIDISAL